MKTLLAHITLVLFISTFCASAASAQTLPDAGRSGRWQLGVHFGELPWDGSFKPGVSFGYHFNDLVYVGAVYQVADRIQRNGRSFNAQSVELAGLDASSERVGQRAYVQVRARPHRLAPYVSAGFVFNDRDTETIQFDARERIVGEHTSASAISITQSRPAGLRPALGFGYSYRMPSGVELHTEWSGWWMFGAPTPTVDITGADLTPEASALLEDRIVKAFTSSPFNTYHVFQIGVGYTW